jgi:hypothetical protein
MSRHGRLHDGHAQFCGGHAVREVTTPRFDSRRSQDQTANDFQEDAMQTIGFIGVGNIGASDDQVADFLVSLLRLLYMRGECKSNF